MPQRELFTIGDLGTLTPLASRPAAPLRRQAARRRAMTGIGATIANWAPPSGLTMTSAGANLQAAATTLQNYLDTNGIPAESASVAEVLAFQQAWDADPLAGTAQLDQDGGYGPNTQAALQALTGLAPSYNPSSQTVVNPGANPSSGGFPWGTALLVGGAALAGYWVFFRRRRSATVSVRTNPRRKGRGKRKAARKKGRR